VVSSKLYSTAEFATRLGVADSTVKSWISRGVIKPHRTGGSGRGNTHLFSHDQLRQMKQYCKQSRRLRWLHALA
jgi:excisionase family DNA binding protein